MSLVAVILPKELQTLTTADLKMIAQLMKDYAWKKIEKTKGARPDEFVCITQAK